MTRNVAVIIDGSIVEGGATAVVLETARALDADIYIGFSDDEDWWTKRAPNHSEVLGDVPKIIPRDIVAAKRIHELNIPEYDTVITSGPPAKFYHPSDNQQWIHYCHHPSIPYQIQNEGVLKKYPLNFIDKVETQSIPRLISNSKLTANRLETYYNRRPESVIAPPVQVNEMNVQSGDGSFVMVGRLSDRKRPDIAVEAFRELSSQLHIIGDGPLRNELEDLATENIKFHGYLSRSDLVSRVEQSSYGIFLSKREDFGITPIELMAAGTPLIAVDEPNTNNQVTEGVSGLLVDPIPEGVRSAATDMKHINWDREAIYTDALQYSVDRFHREIAKFVEGDTTARAKKPKLTFK